MSEVAFGVVMLMTEVAFESVNVNGRKQGECGREGGII
jgi:hypothetical protein